LRSARPSSHGSKRLHRVYHKKYDIWVCQEIGYTVYHQNYRKKKQTRCSDNENIMQMMINSQIWGYIPYVFEKKTRVSETQGNVLYFRMLYLCKLQEYHANRT
jgi:hypothetical protein